MNFLAEWELQGCLWSHDEDLTSQTQLHVCSWSQDQDDDLRARHLLTIGQTSALRKPQTVDGRELPVTPDHLLPEYYSTLRRMEMLAYVTTTCMNLEDTMLREMNMSQRESYLRCFSERQVFSLDMEEQHFFLSCRCANKSFT